MDPITTVLPFLENTPKVALPIEPKAQNIVSGNSKVAARLDCLRDH